MIILIENIIAPTNIPRRPSLGWSGSVCAMRDLPVTPSVFAARWMLKQVQHDAGRRTPLRPLRLCVNPNNRRPNAGCSDGDVSTRTKATRS
jgi:hypothetical protein